MAKYTDSSSSKKDPVVTYVVEQFEKYDKFHQTRFGECRNIIDKWYGKPFIESANDDWHNRVHVPAMIEAEQTITPRIFTALFPTDAPLDIKAEGDTPKEDAIIIKSLNQHYFRVTDVRGKSYPMLTQNTLLGTAYAEAGSWLFKRGWVVSDGGQRFKKIIANRPDFNQVDFFEMFPHPHKMRMDDGMPLIRRRFVDADVIKALEENPFFKSKELKEALESESEAQRPDTQQIYGSSSYKDEDKKEYEILDYWGPWDENFKKKNDKNEEEEVVRRAVPYWTIVINRKVLFRHIPNPYNHQMPPFIKCNLYPDVVPNWFGVGIGKIGMPSQDRLNKIVNQRLDNVDLILNKMGCYNGADPLLNPKKLQESKPGKWLRCSDTVTSIKWIDTPDVTSSSYKEEELARRDFRESVGAVSALQPTDDKNEQHRTALGIQLLQGAAGTRFRPVLNNLEKDFIADTATFFFSNAKQFMTVNEWVEVMGEDAQKMIEVKPEEIQRKVRFIPTGISETVNKEVQISQLLRYKEVTVNDPTINRAEINKRIAELFGFKDLDKIIIQQSPPVEKGQQANQSLSPEQQNLIRQRLEEGASPEQIKSEMLGPQPEDQAQPQEAQAQ